MIKYGAATTPRDRAMTHKISTYIAKVVRAGDPNGAGLPASPRYAAARNELMMFTPDGTASAMPDVSGAAIDAALAR